MIRDPREEDPSRRIDQELLKQRIDAVLRGPGLRERDKSFACGLACKAGRR